MALRIILTTSFALVAIGGSLLIGKEVINQVPLKKISMTKEPKNIKDLLTNKGHKFLDTRENKDNEKWTELIKKYIKNKKTEEIKKIKDLELQGTIDKFDEKDIEKLKNKCNEILKKPIKKDQEFELFKNNAIHWCTDKTSMPSRIVNIG